MTSDGRRRRLAWVRQFRTKTPEHTPLPTTISPDTVAGADIGRTITLSLDGGALHTLHHDRPLPPTRTHFVVKVDPKTGFLRRSWFADDPLAEPGVEAVGAVIEGGLGLMVALPGGRVRRWKLDDGAPAEHAIPPRVEGLFCVAPDRVLCGRDVCDLETGACLFSLDGAPDCAAWDPLSGFLVTGNRDGVAFWATGLGVAIQTLPVDGGVLAMAWDEAGGMVAVGRGGIWRFGA